MQELSHKTLDVVVTLGHMDRYLFLHNFAQTS